jgi:hypothetical protein
MASSIVGDIMNLASEASGVVHVQLVQVEDVCPKELDRTQKVNQQTPNLGHVGSWSDIGNFGHRMYTDEEENATTINYLKNRAAEREEPFTEVFKGNKKKGKPVITRARGRDLYYGWLLGLLSLFCFVRLFFYLAFELEKVLVMSPFSIFVCISLFYFYIYIYIYMVLQMVHHLLPY